MALKRKMAIFFHTSNNHDPSQWTLIPLLQFIIADVAGKHCVGVTCRPLSHLLCLGLVSV